MNKILRKILLLLLIILPACVSAEIVESDLASTSGIIKSFDAKRVTISNVGYTRYSNLLSSGSEGVAITGMVYNDYVKDVDIEVYLNVYDSNKNLLDKIPSKLKIDKKGTKIYKQYIYQDKVKYKMDDIKFYSLSIDVISDLEIVEQGESDVYYLENFNVKVNVSENNVFNVEESFMATFRNHVSVLESGIPFRHVYVREDGSKVNKRAIISNIDIDEYYLLDTKKGIRTISIGKLDKTNTKKNYVINYDYNVGKDILKDNDEFVFYLINNYTAKVDGVSFEIKMPKDFDENNIRFIDQNGIEIKNVVYEVKDNVITGKISGVINGGASYAISIKLEDNYFVNASSNISLLTIMSIIISVLFLVISIILNITNKKTKYTGDIYFNKEFNSLEIGYLYNGKLEDKDIASLLFCLANKGYIEIEKVKKSYKIIKKRNYTGNDRVEKIFMQHLFANNDTLTRKELLKSCGDLKEKLAAKINDKNRIKKIHGNSLLNGKFVYWIMFIIILVLNTINVLIEYQPSVIVFNLVVAGIGYIIMSKGVFSDNKPLEKLLYTLVGMVIVIIPIVLTSYEAFLQDKLNFASYIIGVVCMLTIASFCHKISDRTSYGKRMLNRINAYKSYLLRCSDEILYSEIDKNKYCFYDVLPIAFVLGISDKWVNKFNNKFVEEAKWYKTNKFTVEDFYNDIKNIYSDIFIALKNNGSIE